MDYRVTMMLLILLIAVGAAFYFTRDLTPTVEIESGEQQIAEGGAPLPGLARLTPDDVASIDVTFPDDTGYTLGRGGDDLAQPDAWVQVQPVRFPLSQPIAEAFVENLIGLRHRGAITPAPGDAERDPEALGVASPAARVTINPRPAAQDDGGPGGPVVLELGETTAGGGFVRVQGEPTIYVVPADLHEQVIEQGVNNLRSRALAFPTASRAIRVALRHQGTGATDPPESATAGEGEDARDAAGPVALVMAKMDGQWAFTADHVGRVDPDAVETLLANVRNLRAVEFIEDQPANPAIYGLDAPTVVVQAATLVLDAPAVDDAGAEPLPSAADDETSMPWRTLTIGGPKDPTRKHYFATVADGRGVGEVVVTVSAEQVDRLRMSVRDFRDPRITLARADAVQTIELRRPGYETLRMRRTLDGWRLIEPQRDFGVDAELIRQRLAALTQLQAERFLPGFSPDAPPIIDLRLGVTAMPEGERIRVFAHPSDNTKGVVVRQDEPVGHVVPLEPLTEWIQTPLLAWRDRIAWSPARDQLRRILVRRPDGTTFRFTREPRDEARDGEADANAADEPATLGPWRLIGDDAYEPEALRRLIEVLTPLAVKRWTPGAAEPAIGPGDAYALEADARSTEPLRLWLAPSRDAGRLAVGAAADPDDGRIPGEAFEPGDALAQAIDQEFRERTVLPVAARDIVGITRTSPAGDTLTMQRQRNEDGEIVWVRDTGVTDAAATQLADLLAGLEVQRYVDRPLPEAERWQFEIEVDPGVTHTLVLTPATEGGDDGGLARLGDRVFRLPPDATATLTGDLLEPSAVDLVPARDPDDDPAAANGEAPPMLGPLAP